MQRNRSGELEWRNNVSVHLGIMLLGVKRRQWGEQEIWGPGQGSLSAGVLWHRSLRSMKIPGLLGHSEGIFIHLQRMEPTLTFLSLTCAFQILSHNALGSANVQAAGPPPGQEQELRWGGGLVSRAGSHRLP